MKKDMVNDLFKIENRRLKRLISYIFILFFCSRADPPLSLPDVTFLLSSLAQKPLNGWLYIFYKNDFMSNVFLWCSHLNI